MIERAQCDGCGCTELCAAGVPPGWVVFARDDELRCPECAAGVARVRQVNATMERLMLTGRRG